MDIAVAAALVLLICMPGVAQNAFRRSSLRMPRIQTSLAPAVPGVVTLAILAVLFVVVPSVAIVHWPGQQPTLQILALGLPLYALAVLDARYYWLPDSITLPLIVIGVIAALPADDLASSIIGVLVWGGIPLGVSLLVTRLRGRPAMGLGDAKLMAAMGAWLGIDGGAIAIGAAAIGSLVYAMLIVACRLTHQGWKLKLPFGSTLAISFWIMALWFPG